MTPSWMKGNASCETTSSTRATWTRKMKTGDCAAIPSFHGFTALWLVVYVVQCCGVVCIDKCQYKPIDFCKLCTGSSEMMVEFVTAGTI